MAKTLQPYLRKTLYVVSLAIVIGLLMVLKNNHWQEICNTVSIDIDAPLEKQLITQRIVKDKLDAWYSGGLSGVSRTDINLMDIEDRLEELPAVANAEVSFDLRGELHIYLLQRVPVIRIIVGNEPSYYLSRDGTKILAKTTDAARVPICNGNFDSAMIKKVYTLSTYVYENEFMQALTEQIFVDHKGELIIIPKMQNQQLIIGDTTELNAKFDKLVQFYAQGLKRIGWDKYSIINLKYKDQIVCK